MFLFILFTSACRVKVGIPNKQRPPLINWEDWSIIHYSNTKVQCCAVLYILMYYYHIYLSPTCLSRDHRVMYVLTLLSLAWEDTRCLQYQARLQAEHPVSTVLLQQLLFSFWKETPIQSTKYHWTTQEILGEKGRKCLNFSISHYIFNSKIIGNCKEVPISSNLIN